MDTPRIQYALTDDGVRIAYCAIGSGPPVLWLGSAPFAGSMQSYWPQPWFQALALGLATDHTVITYDPRGTGLSGREVGWLSVERQCLDLDAVLEAAGAPAMDILSWGPYDVRRAVAYIRHTSRTVRRLVIMDGAPSDAGMSASTVQTLGPLLGRDWKLFTETMALVAIGWTDARRYAELVREGLDQHTARRYLAFYTGLDVTPDLPELGMPTLVLHHTGQRLVDFDAAATMAATIPGAQLQTLEGSMGENYEATVEAVVPFLSAAVAAVGGAVDSQAGLRTILFTDLADHTAMMQRLGDARGREVLREHERITRETLAAYGGAEVKALGDGFLASFGSAQKALECAVALLKRFAAAGPLAGIEAVTLHAGVNAGEPIAEDDDLFGSSVILAARAAAKATAGQILVTNVVRELVAGKGFAFSEAGEFELKGFDEPVRLYELRWQELAR
jgi:class 3 adenylate cyclase